MDYAEIGEMKLMLNKFQEQDLMASVEQLGVIKSISDNKKVNDHIDNVIILLKHINPTLFNYPRVARYMEEGEIRGEITRKHIEKLNKEKKNADT